MKNKLTKNKQAKNFLLMFVLCSLLSTCDASPYMEHDKVKLILDLKPPIEPTQNLQNMEDPFFTKVFKKTETLHLVQSPNSDGDELLPLECTKWLDISHSIDYKS